MNTFICALCEREVSELTEHHLIPREEGGRHLETIMICKPCHAQIHALFSNKELALHLYKLSLLKEDDKIKRYLKFIKKHPGDSHINIKKSRNVRKNR
ncbi:HNH endonuclease [Clostridium intestinale]|uniref:HNH endonuclease n=1 Tax=Clostridium intestinale TaxID=36845 RepID=A0A7D6VNT4_9CLOT|nr:HNH endonuclease [Clostridium intestinale]QLY79356.1 HNH endonuclease [Clostridium intestinale]